MISSRTRKTAGKLCVVFIFALVLVLIPALGFDFYYDLNDDMAIRDILSGAYTGTPDGHCIQMLFPLSWLIACCYTAVPALPWYGLFLCICQFGTITLIAWRLLDIRRMLGFCYRKKKRQFFSFCFFDCDGVYDPQ